jgi:hypothetical protein
MKTLPQHVRVITEADAILFMRRIHPERPYKDLSALDEFIVVFWAWEVEGAPRPKEGTDAVV